MAVLIVDVSLRVIIAAARDHGVPIIEDDIYGPLPDNAQPPLAALAPESVYHIAGLAKCVSPMLRVSYVVSPDARQALRVAAAQRKDGTGGKPSGRSTTNTHAFLGELLVKITCDDDLASESP